MEGEENMDIDPAIATAMGFASFGTKPGGKRKYNSNDGYVDPALSSQVSNTQTSSSHTDNAAKAPVDTTTMPETFIAPSSALIPKRPAEATLEELKNGVRNERGDMVYFMPSFLEDPWKDLKPK